MNTFGKIWAAILAVVIFLLLAVFFSSCMTPQKAVNYLKEKKLLDDSCAGNYPCITTDSVVTVISSDSAEYLEVINSLHGDLINAWQLADSLINAISAKGNVSDTNCIKYTLAIRKLQQDNKRLQNDLKNIPPVEKKVEVVKKVRDTALEQVYKDNAEQCAEELEKMTTKKDWWQKAASITWGLLLLLILAGYLIKKFTNKKNRSV